MSGFLFIRGINLGLNLGSSIMMCLWLYSCDVRIDVVTCDIFLFRLNVGLNLSCMLIVITFEEGITNKSFVEEVLYHNRNESESVNLHR